MPLDHARPDGERITVYAREVTADPALPWLLYLGGGPGFAAPRPLGGEGWLLRALRDYRVLLLDQRGTGRSTPVTRRVALDRGAEYLTHFRADSIVRDAEAIRARLLGDVPWTVLGQSFGGFCTVSYLSFAPGGLRAALVTGGLPGVETDAVGAYRALYPVVAEKNEAHYRSYPQDVEQARRVAAYLREHRVRLPTGRRLTLAAFQSLGNLLGGRDGSARLHYLLESPFDGAVLSDAFLLDAAAALSWATAANPLYYLLHEPTYAQGPGATAWAAHRVRAEFPEFVSADPVYFTGEMIYPWMFDDDPLMAPLRGVADDVAARPEWPMLYDVDRLRANEVRWWPRCTTRTCT
ncbi:alpha/beta fold hydrolase [Actinophytocola algeriensis]|uniref:Pimeloyl-ACP methyl ester carboxylesterase n=1 Tax=Actinophytocola algeriensis TaxID=1768010 RepID=A0A7W7Q264_9PSEU|nr:alpha/beta fold hydrolase [Actinophytocola algeriensis]MBB4905634.1 pimeloyl-ACP methyl ester carboxylesterase [Actinophytocola algeriensis]MBE1472681.1 pimeloyl-ACP methyl ester carboxylesterase [Actinophytocola algeriensis]